MILVGIRQGWGGTKTLEVYRELGGQIREAEFFRLWRETFAAIGASLEALEDKTA